MTKDDIIRMAREATRVIEPDDPDYRQEIFDKEKFANLVAAAEREECARVAEETNVTFVDFSEYLIAKAIRARGTT